MNRALVGGAILASIIVSIALPSAADPLPDSSVQDTDDLVRVTLPLAHPTDLRSAVEYGTGLDAVAYGFDNGYVVGEYAPGSGQSVDDYLVMFGEEFGTSPAVTNIVVLEPAPARRSSVIAGQVGEALPAYSAPPVQFGGETLRKSAVGMGSALGQTPQALQAGDWRPDATSHDLVPATATTGLIWQEFAWTGGGLYSLPNGIGLEFEINLDNPNVAAPNNLRPNCSDSSYKDRFWLKNYAYSWSVTDLLSPNASTFGAYADYNDLTDACRKNSIAIGMRYPKNMQGMSMPDGLETRLEVSIIAPRGLTTYSHIGGNVQAVTSSFCGAITTLTDCMGVNPIQSEWAGYPSGVYNRSTLNIGRGWTAPSTCWRTWNTGSNIVSYACP